MSTGRRKTQKVIFKTSTWKKLSNVVNNDTKTAKVFIFGLWKYLKCSSCHYPQHQTRDAWCVGSKIGSKVRKQRVCFFQWIRLSDGAWRKHLWSCNQTLWDDYTGQDFKIKEDSPFNQSEKWSSVTFMSNCCAIILLHFWFWPEQKESQI